MPRQSENLTQLRAQKILAAAIFRAATKEPGNEDEIPNLTEEQRRALAAIPSPFDSRIEVERRIQESEAKEEAARQRAGFGRRRTSSKGGGYQIAASRLERWQPTEEEIEVKKDKLIQKIIHRLQPGTVSDWDAELAQSALPPISKLKELDLDQLRAASRKLASAAKNKS